MPATYPIYPEASDIEAQIAAIGVELPAGFDAEPYAFAAIKEWEDGTRYWPFLKGASAEFRYSPPGANDRGEWRGNSRRLLLDRGFVAVSEIAWGDDVLVEDEDYRLLPANAEYDLVPYTIVEFTKSRRGAPLVITLTGEPGYCEELPAIVWMAIRDLAVGRMLEAIREGIAANPLDYKEGDISEKYESATVKTLGSTFVARALKLMRQYRRAW